MKYLLKSIIVSNISFNVSAFVLQKHFKNVKRVTILKNDKQKSKGIAYLEFEKPSDATKALKLNKTLFKGRVMQIRLKRSKRFKKKSKPKSFVSKLNLQASESKPLEKVIDEPKVETSVNQQMEVDKICPGCQLTLLGTDCWSCLSSK